MGLQVAGIVAVVATQAVMAFFSTHRILVIEPKEGSWQTIAQYAQGYNSTCQIELEGVKKQLEIRAEEQAKELEWTWKGNE